MVVHPTRRRFTVSEYHQMAEAGILREDDRVELIEGEVTEMTPIGRRHALCVNRLTELFVVKFRAEAMISVQNPVAVSEYSEPQPDLVLARRHLDLYAAGHPPPADVLLLVEVGETTAELDRRVKVPLYARGGIAEVWLVDLQHETITVYRDPTPGGYRTVQVVRRAEQLAPQAFPDRPLPVADILG